MNPLMDALRRIGDPRPPPAARGDDAPSILAAPPKWRLDPIRATEDDDGPGVPDPGLVGPDRLSPPRAAHCGGTAGNPAVSAHDLPHGASGSDVGAALPDGIAWPSPSHVDDEAVDEPAPATAPSMEAASAPAESRPGRLPHRPVRPEPALGAPADTDAGERPPPRPSPDRCDAREPRPAAHRDFDPGMLPRRRGAARVAGVALSLLAAVGVGAGGGYHLWKTRFVRPALVRDLSWMPAPVVALSPVDAANAATAEAAGSAAGASAEAPLRPREDPAAATGGPAEAPPAPSAAERSVAEGRTGSQKVVAVEAAVSTGEVEPRAASVAGVPASRAPEGSRTPGAVGAVISEGPERPRTALPAAAPAPEGAERVVAPARHVTSPESLKSAPEPRYADGLSPGRREHVSMPPPRPPPTPTVEPGEHARVDSAAGLGPPTDAAVEPTAPAGTGSPAGAAGSPAPAMARSAPEPRPGPGAGIEIRRGRRADHVAASLDRAYEAFRAGDVESAAEAYRAVVGHEPGNRDAHLGLAAVAMRAGRWDEAAGHYARVLASHPADAVARAALIAIEEPDPVRGESGLKALLWSEPEAAYLHFNLGNVYAAQSRWSEAHRSYLDAYRFDRKSPDYAYNLAVSLDHLSRESALDFYREALALARGRPASFDTAAVLARIREMDASAGEDLPPAPPPSEPAEAAPAAGGR